MKPGPEFPLGSASPESTQDSPNVIPKSPDPHTWDAIRQDYRSGLTYSKLSEKYATPIPAIVARRKAEQWRKDLREDVKAETFGRLAADSVPLGSVFSDEAVVEAASKVGAQVISRHRKLDGTTVEALIELAEEVRDQIRLARRADPVDFKLIGYLSGTALNVANAIARVQMQERIAHGLNDKFEEKPYEERLKEFYATQRAARTIRAQERKREAKIEADSAIRAAAGA